MFACGAINPDGSCAQWVEIATWAHLSPDDAVRILTAACMTLAIAWGFRLLLRLLFNR